MPEIRVPEFEWKPLGRAGGTYDRRSPMKIGWHTWEGTNWSSAESTFNRYPPHIGAKYPEQPRQYVDLARHSYAYKGSESDDEPIIQLELAGFARDMRFKDDAFLRWLAGITDSINRALHSAGWDTVDPVVPPQGFKDELDREWAPLASARSRLRFTDAELEAFRGHLGHQHVPAPDSHWDPGALNVQRMLTFCQFTPGQEEDEMTHEEFLVAIQPLKDKIDAIHRQVVAGEGPPGKFRMDRLVEIAKETHDAVVKD